MPENDIECPKCHEVQSANNIRCSRCGTSLESKEHRKARLAGIERSRRDAEHSDVSIERLPGFGTNGTPAGVQFGTKGYVAAMSNQRKRRILIVVAVMVIGMVFFYSHG